MNDYQLIKQLVDEMNVGEIKTIDKPENVDNFRSYLSIVSSKKDSQQRLVAIKCSLKELKKRRLGDCNENNVIFVVWNA